MDRVEENLQLKDAIFDGSKYSKTKKLLGIIFLTSVFLLRVIGTDKTKMIAFIAVFTVTVIGVIYWGCKIFLYNKERNSKDIIFLIIFGCLFVWA